MARVFVGSALRRFTGGAEEVEVEGSTVRALIDELERRFPGFGRQVASSGAAVAVDGEIMADALYEPVPPGAEVHFLPPIGGG